MSIEVTVQGGTSKKLLTGGKYCPEDIIVIAENSGTSGGSAYEERTAELSETGFTRINGSNDGSFSLATTGQRTGYISTEGVTKIFGNAGFYYSCATIAFYDASQTYLPDISVDGTAFIATSGSNYGDGTFELDITGEEYADAAYFVVSTYRNSSQAGYYTQAMDFSVDYCKYMVSVEGSGSGGSEIETCDVYISDGGGYLELITATVLENGVPATFIYNETALEEIVINNVIKNSVVTILSGDDIFDDDATIQCLINDSTIGLMSFEILGHPAQIRLLCTDDIG